MAHRIASSTVTVLGPDGPLAAREVTVEQIRHEFGFGNIGFDFLSRVGGPDPEGAEGVEAFGSAGSLPLEVLEPAWLELYNMVTLPFYWGRYEPRRGRPDTERLRRTAEWFASRGVRVKGHPLTWHTIAPAWLDGLPLDEVERLQRERIRDVVGGFAGLIDTWDAINEAVIMPVFANGDNRITDLARRIGRIPMIRLAFEEARAANPSATLLINDFDLSSAYECLIEGVLEAGIRIDAIGLQTHMHQGYRGEERITAILDRFARYGLPLHMTESTLVSGRLMPPEIEDLNDYRIPSWPSTPEGEERQADEMVRHYRTLVGHPAVQVVNYWGLTDDGAWLGAPVGLLRADGSKKPSYEALRGLIKGEWWLAPTTVRTDGQGRVPVAGFRGDYRVSGEQGRADFRLDDADDADVTVRLER
ncbi:MAG: endo,4-beta-xylanase [Microbacteriaceae bacterium]|nr:endo,4-beta-xylanase [Microbacteriaceae bacterium]